MMISSDAMDRIEREVYLGLPPTPDTPEEAAFRERAKAAFEKAKKEGVALHVPSEWPLSGS